MAFNVLDKDGDGELAVEEIKWRFSYTNYENLTKLNVEDDFWQKLIDDFDSNSNGTITFNEFKESMLRSLNTTSTKKSWFNNWR